MLTVITLVTFQRIGQLLIIGIVLADMSQVGQQDQVGMVIATGTAALGSGTTSAVTNNSQLKIVLLHL